MTGDILKELDEIRKEQGIEKNAFEEILACVLMFQRQSNQYIFSSELREIVMEALSRFDDKEIYREDKIRDNSKTPKQAVEEALRALGYKHNK